MGPDLRRGPHPFPPGHALQPRPAGITRALDGPHVPTELLSTHPNRRFKHGFH